MMMLYNCQLMTPNSPKTYQCSIYSTLSTNLKHVYSVSDCLTASLVSAVSLESVCYSFADFFLQVLVG